MRNHAFCILHARCHKMAALRSENGIPTALSLDSTQAFLDMMQVETLTCDIIISSTVFGHGEVLRHVQLYCFCGLSGLSAEML